MIETTKFPGKNIIRNIMVNLSTQRAVKGIFKPREHVRVKKYCHSLLITDWDVTVC